MAQRVAGEQYESITGQLFEIARQLRQKSGYPHDPETLKLFLQRAVEGRFIEENNTVTSSAKVLGGQLLSWVGFYERYFGLVIDPWGVDVPEYVGYLDALSLRLIVVAQGLTLNRVYDACAREFPCFRYVDDLDAGAPVNDRTPTESYAIWVRDRVEADEENANLSAEDLNVKRIKCQTIMERMLHELKYFSETGEHLDVTNWTLCSGSRCSDGSVPGAGWSSGGREFRVGGYDPRDRYADLRARAGVR